MNIQHLLILDYKKIRFWFGKNSASKLLVLLLTLALAFGFTLIMHQLSYFYFLGISLYEPYARATTSYLLHSALLMTVWFGITSSVISCMAMLFTQSKELSFILSLPISKTSTSIWFTLRSGLITFSILCFLFVPTLLAVLRVYPPESLPLMASTLFFTILFLTIIIEVIGKSVGILFAPFISRQKYIWSSVGLLVFFVLTLLFLRTLFPPSLKLIRLSIQDDFFTLFEQLPLNQGWAVTASPSTFLFSQNILDLSPLFLVGSLIILIGILLLNTYLLDSFQLVNSFSNHSIPFSRTLKSFFSRWPLRTQTFLSIWRVHSERSFLFFFCGMLLFFFFFFRRALLINSASNTSPILLQIGLGTVLFFGLALSLRIIFPLLSRLSLSAWYFLSFPIDRKKYINDSFFVSLLITLPFTIIATTGWLFIHLSTVIILILSLLTLIGMVLLYRINWLVGVMLPDWQLGDSPDEISTSVSGLLTLFCSISTVILMLVSFEVMSKSPSTAVILATTAFWALLIIVLMVLSSKLPKILQEYQYPNSE